jgi:SAM-dependent methyltransferase
MPGSNVDTNLRTYGADDVAAHYASLDYLTACEQLLFASYIRTGSAILDLGVGGGRTTPYLASRASRYVGLDYSSAMVKACQKKFPGLEFVVADAADLSVFSDASFDALVFAFNGLDALSIDGRRSCLEHLYRILKPGGVLIFSSHNPRAVIIRRSWNRERLWKIAKKYSAGAKWLCWIWWILLASIRIALAYAQTIGATLLRAVQRVPTRMFWHGEGTRLDITHGIVTHYWTPHRAVRELTAFRFSAQRILGDDYPQASHAYATDWYYYVFTKHCEK